MRTSPIAALAAALIVAGAAPATAAEGHQHDTGPAAPAPTSVVVPQDGPEVVVHPSAGRLADLLRTVPDGGVLVLPPGTYQGPVVIDRPVTIVGEGLPLIDGDGTGSVITIRADGVELRGIAVRGSGPGPTDNPAAIRIEADDVRIERVVVEDAYTGIAVAGASRVTLVDNVVRGRAAAAIGDEAHAVEDNVAAPGLARANTDTGATPTAGGDGGHAGAHTGDHAGHDAGWKRGDGIWLHDTEAVLVRGNLVEDARDGIFAMFAERTLVDGNRVHRSRYAVHSMWAEDLALAENTLEHNLSGAVLMYGADLLLLKNTIRENRSTSTGFGLLLKDVVAVQADRNLLVENRVGIHLDGPAGSETQTVFTGNTIVRNDVGVAAYSSARAAFRANSFAENLVQVMPQGGALNGVHWIHEGTGNFWSTYRGYASSEPGRGAVAHVEGGAVDRMLLRNPELAAIAGSPALRLLRSIEERWGTRSPAAVDHVPLTRPVSPPVPDTEDAPVGPATSLVLGALLLIPSALTLWRPRRRTTTLRRTTHVVTT